MLRSVHEAFTDGLTKKRSGRNRLYRTEALWGILCVAPAVLGFLLWQLGPIVGSLFIAFTDWTVANTPRWIGTKNFEQMLLHDELFYKSLTVTTIYAAVSVPLNMLVAFAVALLFHQRIKGRAIFRTIFYLPSTVPLIASSVIWLWLFNPEFGLLNSILKPLGAPKFQWIYDETTVLPSLILMNLWGIGPMMIIFLAGLQGIPKYLDEAIEVDGGRAIHKLWHITIPMMTPTILFNLILSTIDISQVFTQPYIMTQGGPNNASLLYVLYLYRKAFQEYQMGYASALAWVFFIIIAVISFLILQTSRRWVYYEGGF